MLYSLSSATKLSIKTKLVSVDIRNSVIQTNKGNAKNTKNIGAFSFFCELKPASI